LPLLLPFDVLCWMFDVHCICLRLLAALGSRRVWAQARIASIWEHERSCAGRDGEWYVIC